MLVVAANAATASSAAPSLDPEDLPANTVAVVSHVPAGLGRITRAELQRTLVENAAAAGLGSVPKPESRRYERLKDQALGERLDSVWIEGQAAMMGIDVAPRQVARELDRIKKASFESNAEYHRFLKQFHYTRRDVNERVRLQLLAVRIQERIARNAGPRESDVRRAFKEFVAEYQQRWRARTVCAPDHAIDRCSNGSPSSAQALKSI